MDLTTLLNTLNQAETGAISPTGPGLAALQRINPANLPPAPAASGDPADLYHGPDFPASASLLAQSGVNAYVQLLSVLATRELYQQSADLLTSNLGNASAALKSAYHEAVSQLSAQLQTKDWGFSISNLSLIHI